MNRYGIRIVSVREVIAMGARTADGMAPYFCAGLQATRFSKCGSVYLQHEAAGRFFGVAAVVDNEWVGYSGCFIGPHIHYANLRYALNDIWVFAAAYVDSPICLALIEATADEARRRGARMVMWPAGESPLLAERLRGRGYVVDEVIFQKDLLPAATTHSCIASGRYEQLKRSITRRTQSWQELP